MVEEIQIKTIIECFSGLTDPRIDLRRFHKLIGVVVIGLCAIISGGEGFIAMEAYAPTAPMQLRYHVRVGHLA